MTFSSTLKINDGVTWKPCSETWTFWGKMACLPTWRSVAFIKTRLSLGYVVSSQGIWIEDERIEAVRSWPKPKSVRDIQVFISFANFYRQFIRDFSRIATPLTSMLKTTRLSNLAPKELGADEVVEGGGKNDDRNLSKSKKSKNVKSEIQTCVGAAGEPIFLTPGAREAFNQLRQAFTKALILWHFDPECHIRIETDTSG